MAEKPKTIPLVEGHAPPRAPIIQAVPPRMEKADAGHVPPTKPVMTTPPPPPPPAQPPRAR